MNILSDDYRVLFVEPGLHSKKYTRRLVTQSPKRLLPTNWFRQEKEKLWVYSPQVLPLYRAPHFLMDALWRLALTQIRAFCRRHDFDAPVLWFYSPEALPVVGKLGESLLIYDCVDNYVATPYYAKSQRRSRHFRALEARLLQQVDVVATTSPSLWEEKRKYNASTFLVPNVGDVDHFRKAALPETVVADDIANVPHPIVGFVGAVNEHKVDFQLVRYIAEAQPDWQIVLIGPIGGWGSKTNVEPLSDLPNVHLMGSRPYEVLPNYIKAFDVCIIPYTLNEYTKGVFPLKFFEFLATGKPIITTALPSLLQYRDVVGVAYSYSEFEQYIKSAFAEPANNIAARQAIANQNTWSHRVTRLLDLVQDGLSLGANV